MAFRPLGMRGERGPLGEQRGAEPLFYSEVKPVASTMVAEVVGVEPTSVEQPVEAAPQEQIAA